MAPAVVDTYTNQHEQSKKLDQAQLTSSLNSFIASGHSQHSCVEPLLTKSIAHVPLGLKVQGALVILADFFEVHEDWFDWSHS